VGERLRELGVIMLADQFVSAEQAMQQEAQEERQRHAERDEFIRVQYPALTLAFSQMADAATGVHPRLAVARGTVTEVFTGRGFTSLDNVQIDVRSTLYGAPEIVRFASSLESVVDSQFGVFHVTTDGLKPKFRTDGDGPLFQSMLTSGVLMTGTAAAALTVRNGVNLTPLTLALLEGFLAALLVRS
jgi:hypothetical protein